MTKIYLDVKAQGIGRVFLENSPSFKQEVTSEEMVQRSGICSLLAAESRAFEAAF